MVEAGRVDEGLLDVVAADFEDEPSPAQPARVASAPPLAVRSPRREILEGDGFGITSHLRWET